MSKIEKATKLIEEATSELTRKLTHLGVPIDSFDVDTDDMNAGEPFCHIHLELNEEWFFDEKGGVECED